MGTTIERIQTICLRTNLLKRLRIAAKRENRSLNNHVENVLIDIECNEPNEHTKDAIDEARSGRFAGSIDMTNFDTFTKSINDIE